MKVHLLKGFSSGENVKLIETLLLLFYSSLKADKITFPDDWRVIRPRQLFPFNITRSIPSDHHINDQSGDKLDKRDDLAVKFMDNSMGK